MKILFVCTGNTYRSIMAELTLKEKLKQKFGESACEKFQVDSSVMNRVLKAASFKLLRL